MLGTVVPVFVLLAGLMENGSGDAAGVVWGGWVGGVSVWGASVCGFC